jgi:hypothetical protein
MVTVVIKQAALVASFQDEFWNKLLMDVFQHHFAAKVLDVYNTMLLKGLYGVGIVRKESRTCSFTSIWCFVEKKRWRANFLCHLASVLKLE